MCREAGVFVIEDCCESHGALLDCGSNKRIGTFGDIPFSFFGHHIQQLKVVLFALITKN